MQWEHGVEQPPEFYDWSFEGNEHWRVHYTESHYYPLRSVVADRVQRAGAERDLDVLRRLRPGTRVIATVPNFAARGHVRYFDKVERVADRYAPCFASLSVEAHVANTEGKTYYLMDGETGHPN